jgi:hypothetical protein
MNVKSKFGLQGIRRRTVLLSVFLLVITVLVFSYLFFASNDSKDPTPIIPKTTETDLKNTINNATEPTVITLENDLQLTESLTISCWQKCHPNK